jgi:5-methylcytosine-specific restriction endonuclease McrA
MRAKREADPESVNAYKRLRYADNPTATRALNKAYRDANREELNRRQMSAYYENRDAARLSRKFYYQSNREKLRALYLAAYEANPEIFKARASARRARKKGAEGRYTSQDVQAIYALQGKRCANLNCGASITKRHGSRKPTYHIDHIIPLKLGGSNWPENIQLLCPPCNRAKAAKPPLEFARECGVLF